MPIETVKPAPELCYSTNGENYHMDFCHVADNLEVGDTFHEADAKHYMPSQFFSIDRLIDDLQAQAYEAADEFAEDFASELIGKNNPKRDELKKLIGDWLDVNLSCNFYTAENDRKVELTQEMIDGVPAAE